MWRSHLSSICEICEKAPAVTTEVIRLCADCSDRYIVLLDWAKQHPQLSEKGLESLKEAMRAQRNKRKAELPRTLIESFESQP